MVTDENDILLKPLVKWFIKLTISLNESIKPSAPKKALPKNISEFSFEITYYILILHVLRSGKLLKDFELFKKKNTKNENINLAQLFKRHNKVLKYFGYKAKCHDFEIKSDIIREIDCMLSTIKTISPVIINSFYEAALSIHFKKKDKKLSFSFDNAHRKKHGIFYTPQKLAFSTVQNVMAKMIAQKSNKDFSCKILDPSCGCGIFLYECYDQLLNSQLFSSSRKQSAAEDQFALFSPVITGHKNNMDDKQRLLLNSLFGIDLDPLAVKITKTLLLLRMMQGENNFCLTNKIIKSLDKNFAVGSFFDEPIQEIKPSEEKPKEMSPEAEKIGKILSKKFDIIIGNPPWITFRKNEIGAKRWNILRERYKSVSVFKMNTFPIFVERSIEIMRKGSIIAFITPQRILDTPSYSGLRKILVDNQLISCIDNLSGSAFDNVIADTIILQLNNMKKDHFLINRQNDNLLMSDTEKSFFSEITAPDYKINIHSRIAIKPIIDKIDNVSSSLKKYFNVHVGIMIKNKKLHYTSPDKGTPIITSKCFSKFSSIEPKFVNLKKSLIFGGTKNPDKQTVSPKIIVRKTGKEIVSTIDFHGNYAEQSCYILLPKDNSDILFLCAYLNSDLVKFYFLNNLMTNPDSFPYVQHYDLEKIPVFKFDNNLNKKRTINSIKTLSSKIFSLHGKYSNRTQDHKKKIHFDRLQDKINLLVYSLYEFSEDEIKLINGYLKLNN